MLHHVPQARVVATGAQLFDEWFEARPSRSREEFCRETGLDPARPFVLYVGSSSFIAPDEVPFVERWLSRLRRAPSETLRGAGVLVRPHPANSRQWRAFEASSFSQVSLWPPVGAEPNGPQARRDYVDSMWHCAAVVGINTSAQIEAAIVGRPVFTIRDPHFAHAQDGTLHFRHLVAGADPCAWRTRSTLMCSNWASSWIARRSHRSGSATSSSASCARTASTSQPRRSTRPRSGGCVRCRPGRPSPIPGGSLALPAARAAEGVAGASARRGSAAVGVRDAPVPRGRRMADGGGARARRRLARGGASWGETRAAPRGARGTSVASGGARAWAGSESRCCVARAMRAGWRGASWGNRREAAVPRAARELLPQLRVGDPALGGARAPGAPGCGAGGVRRRIRAPRASDGLVSRHHGGRGATTGSRRVDRSWRRACGERMDLLRYLEPSYDTTPRLRDARSRAGAGVRRALRRKRLGAMGPRAPCARIAASPRRRGNPAQPGRGGLPARATRGRGADNAAHRRRGLVAARLSASGARGAAPDGGRGVELGPSDEQGADSRRARPGAWCGTRCSATKPCGCTGSRRRRVVVTGAQCFDHWFGRRPSRTRAEFCAAAGLPADKPFLLYVGSALFAGSPSEAAFVQQWIAAIRASADAALRSCAILVRPHPQRMREWEAVDVSALRRRVGVGRQSGDRAGTGRLLRVAALQPRRGGTEHQRVPGGGHRRPPRPRDPARRVP